MKSADGTPTTADDAVFSFAWLPDSGLPCVEARLASLKSLTRTDDRHVRLQLSAPAVGFMLDLVRNQN